MSSRVGQNRKSADNRSQHCKTAYPSLVDARLPMVPCNVPEFVLHVGGMSRHRDRLGDEVRKRGLAVFDGNGGDV